MSYRSTPLAGVLAFVAFVAAVFIVESGEMPPGEASGAELAEYLNDNVYRFALAALAWGIGSILVVVLFEGIRRVIAAGSDQLARVGFALGLGAVVLLLASWLPEVGGSLASREEFDRDLDPGAAEAITALGDGFFFGGEILLGGFLLAVGLAAVTTRVLSTWLGWVSLALGVVALVPPIGWAVVVFAFPLWILVVSALLWRRSPEPVAP